MQSLILIPARLASTRLPQKMLAEIDGEPLIVHTARNASLSGLPVIVATEAPSILAAVEAAGFKAVLTSGRHRNGTECLAEAALLLNLHPDTVIINVQGDEPCIDPVLIQQLASSLEGSHIATACVPLANADELQNPNVVKVVCTGQGKALYFSRSPLPFARNSYPQLGFRHLGIYAYTANFLQIYNHLSPTPLSEAESLEQLRALEHGFSIAVKQWTAHGIGIDTEADLNAYRKLKGSPWILNTSSSPAALSPV